MLSMVVLKIDPHVRVEGPQCGLRIQLSQIYCSDPCEKVNLQMTFDLLTTLFNLTNGIEL